MTSSIPKTCRAVVLDGPNAPWAIKDIPVNEPKQGEILIKVEACGICHSDSFLQQGAFGPLGTFPRIPGHETIGHVVAVGSGEKKWKIGDRVGGAWHGGHDGTCSKCAKGFYQMCDNGLVNGVNRDGGFAEYTLLRSEAAVGVPEEVDAAEYAPQLCAGITVFNGMRKLGVPPGETVAIQGLGGLGHLAIQFARKMGYRTVALSNGSAKKEFAIQLGATDYIDTSKEDAAEALKKIGGASMIVVTAPIPSIMGPLVGGLGPCGKLLILAPVGDVPINTGLLVSGGTSVHGWPSGHAIDSEETIAFAQQQGVKCMIEKFTFNQIEQAIKRMHSNEIRFRGVLVME